MLNATDLYELLSVAPVKMQELCDGMKTAEKGNTEDALESVILKAAWQYGYVAARYGAGCGDQGHEEAVHAANSLLKKVRKAMGFTYPERGAIRV